MSAFRGTERYEVVRELGAGGSGVVYEVVDHGEGDRHVALKVLRKRVALEDAPRQQVADSALRFKHEFRQLSALRHHNIVSVLDSGVLKDDPQNPLFFTMELVQGVDFLDWVRVEGPDLGDADTLTPEMAAPAALGRRFDEARLRDALKQLGQGVRFLHAEGRVHRDLKPSNVKVTPDGRVVILDFGLVKTVRGTDGLKLDEGLVAGTVLYMAPEQARADEVGPEADWYAVGVMLFHALTGRMPFDGSNEQVMEAKVNHPAPAPRDVAANVPEDLDRLCVALLRKDPTQRPKEAEVLTALGVAPESPSPSTSGAFLGRFKELGELVDALKQTRQGHPVLALVTGTSGIGKSALVRQFTELSPPETVVLQGRCYEREAVPFKALDSLVDSLAVYLGNLPADRVDALLPRDPQAIARMFPVMNRVEAISRAPARTVHEPREQRRRAIHALRELLGRLADRAPVVVFLDDAQWGDTDSARIFIELTRPPDPPSLMMVVASRVDVGLRQLPGVKVVEVPLGGLPPEACEELARRALTDDEARVAAVARESGGNPFLLHLLAAHGQEGAARLEDVVASRVAALAGPARAALEVVTVCSAPVAPPLVLAAAGLKPADLDVIQQLKDARLIRGMGERGTVETWHDRIRETVVAALSHERVREIHARMAEALRQAKDGDVDTLAWHLGAAGMTGEAAEATLSAARDAVSQLSFERAALLFRRVLELLPLDDPRRRELLVQLGDALSNAGRGVEAAEAYGQAQGQTALLAQGGADEIELKRRAAEQLLRSGRINEGLGAVKEVLKQVGMRWPRTPFRAWLVLGWWRLRVFIRGLGFVERKEAEIAPEVLRKIDTCWSVALGLSMVDTVRGASFQTRQLLLALDAGEPGRVARSLAAEAAFLATGGIAREEKTQKLVNLARGIATGVGDARLLGLIDFTAGLTRFLVGRWRESQQLSAEAERRFREAGWTVSWEAATARLFSVWSLYYLGEVLELGRRVKALVGEAQSRGDLYTVASLQIGLSNVTLLAADDPKAARAAVREVMKEWASGAYHFQHYWALLSESLIDLYEQRAEEGWQRINAQWKALKNSLLLEIQNVDIEARSVRARLALATGRAEEALSEAAQLEQTGARWARAQAVMIRGLVAGKDGVSQLKQAREEFEAQEMRLFANAVRLRLGELEGGAAGDAERDAAMGWMRQQGIVTPGALLRTLAPALKGGSAEVSGGRT